MVVRAVVKEGVRQASRIFGLSPKTVIAWIRDFSKKGSE
jgi:transposase